MHRWRSRTTFRARGPGDRLESAQARRSNHPIVSFLAVLSLACATSPPPLASTAEPTEASDTTEATTRHKPAPSASAASSTPMPETAAADSNTESPQPESESVEAPIPDSEAEKETAEAERKLKERKQRQRVLLKTAYDDRTLGEEQTSLVEAELGIYADEALEKYVRSVAVRLLRHAPPQPFDYEFKIVDQVVPNAFAIPGGKIYVSRGLLALVGSEDELAAVLGHEITHAAERHSAARIEHARRINPLTIGLARAASIAAYGREHERDADRGGQILAAKAGYNPVGIATFLRKLDASERYEIGWSRLPFFLATHPTSPERSAIASQRATELSWEKQQSVAAGMGYPGGYAEIVDGLILGDDPAGGLFKDGRFVHPDMRFSIRFPPGWETANSPQAVSAGAPDRDAEASLTAVGTAGDLDETIDEFLATEFEGVKLRVLDRRPIKVRDIPGIRVTGRARDFHAVMVFFEHEGLVFRLSLLTAVNAERKYRGRAHAFVQSFRPLDDEGIYSLEVMRLRVARALPNETLQQLSARTHNDLELVYTGVLNDLFAQTPLAGGQMVKIGLSEPYFPKPRETAESVDEQDGTTSDGTDDG